jgi:RHS repeat-associated protein
MRTQDATQGTPDASRASSRRRGALGAGIAAALIALVVTGAMTVLGGGKSSRAGDDRGAVTRVAAPTVAEVRAARALDPIRPPQGAHLVASKTSARSLTYVLPDGSHMARVFSEPVLYRSGGGWKRIDNSFVLSRDGGLRNRANRYGVSLPGTLGARPVTVRRGSAWASFALRGAGGAAARARGNVATYADVLPRTSATYTANADSVQELLTLAGPGAPSSFSYRLDVSAGLRPHRLAGGGLTFTDAKGRRVALAVEPTVAWAKDHPERPRALRERLSRSGGHWLLTLSADRTWLSRALARGPVLVDPTVTITGASADCVLASELPTTASCTATTLLVGYNGSNDRRALVKHSLTSIPRDAIVLNAALKLNITAHSTSTTKSVGVYNVKRAWTTAATWNNYDATNAWATAGASGAADIDSPAADARTVGAANGLVSWYPTKLVQGWVDGSIANNGVIVRDVTASTTNNRLTISSSEASSNKPVLQVIYEPRGGELPGYNFDTQRLTDRMETKVNVANGNLIVHNSDPRIPGNGLDFSFERYVNSLSSAASVTGSLGRGGTATMGRDVRLQLYGDGSAGFYRGDGVALPFIKNSSGGFDPPPFLNAGLVLNGDGTYTLTYNRGQTKLKFSSAGQLTSITDQNNNQVSLFYTASGALDHVNDTRSRTMTATANNTTDNFVASITDGANVVHTWAYTYGGTGTKFLTDATDPQSHVVHFDYDTSGRINQITSPASRVTKITYDAQGRVATLIRTTNASNTTGPTTTFSYTDAGAQTYCTTGGRSSTFWTAVTDPNSHTSYFCFDAQDRLTASRDAESRNRSTSYTLNGDIDTGTSAGGSTLPGFETKNLYSGFNSPTQRDLTTGTGSSPSKLTDKASYNSTAPTGCTGPGWLNFYPDTTTDPQSNVTNYTYDCAGNLKDSTSGGVTASLGSYDSKGNPHTSTDGNGNVTSYGYDTAGRLISITPPTTTAPSTQLGATTIGWDSMSRVVSIQDGKGQTTSYDYDAIGRLKTITYQDGSTVALTYTSDGNLTNRDETTGGVTKNTSYTYDKLNRLTREDFPDASFNAYGYDNVGNLTSYQDASGTTTYSQGAANFLSGLTEPGASSGYSFTTNDNAVRSVTTYPNGVTVNTTSDGAGRVLTLLATKGATTLKSLTYAYHPSTTSVDHELLDTLTDNVSHDVTQYSYDPLNRLTRALTTNGGTTVRDFQYTLDNDGNITRRVGTISGTTTTTSYAYNETNQLCWSYNGTASPLCGTIPSGATTYTYDADGNQTADSSAFSATYNVKNQTTALNGSSLGYFGAGQNELIGDAGATLHNSILDTTSRTASGTTDYFTRDDQGTLLADRGPSSTSYYLLDAQSSVIGTTDSAGASSGSWSYDPYGRAIGTAPSPFAYVSGYRSSSGLYHFGARFYNPSDQRWTQVDSVNQTNRYAYVADPINNVDVSGMLSLKGVLRAGLRGAGFVAYGVYYGSYQANTYLHSPLLSGIQAGGLAADAGIDVLKNWTLNNGEPVGDEGRNGFINPYCDCGPQTYFPGIHRNGKIDFHF